MQEAAYGFPRMPLPRTTVNKGKKEGRSVVPRSSGYLCRILVRVPHLPLLRLERLAQRGVLLRRDDQVLILVLG